MELLFRGDEQLIIDNNEHHKLKEIRGYHILDKDGKEMTATLKFYDAYITPDGELDANYKVFEDGSKEMFEIVINQN